VLDLDETLVHCTVEPIQNPDHMFRVRFNEEVCCATSFLVTSSFACSNLSCIMLLRYCSNTFVSSVPVL
jgi:hypothetical protein